MENDSRPTSHRDEVFSQQREPASFCFNEEVAAVFPDMIERSVPGYDFCLKTISGTAKHLVQANSRIYDLGCSLGSITMAIRSGVTAAGLADQNVVIHAIDSSEPMIQRAAAHIAAFRPDVKIDLYCEDITQTSIHDASLVVLAYTLQFIKPEERLTLIKKIHDGLKPQGGFILIEKTHEPDPKMQACLTELHHEFKRINGYSELEIAQKRQALENVLITEPEENHVQRLRQGGFTNISLVAKHYNFSAWLAIRD